MQKNASFIKELAKKAGEIHLETASDFSVYKKEGIANLVTDADYKSEKYIIETIRKYFPNDGIISEESEDSDYKEKSQGAFWIIDPLDGTNNFAHKRNFSVCSIAYGEQGEIKMGAVYNPFANEMFFAEKGKGSYLNDAALRLPPRDDTHHMTIGTGPSNEDRFSRKNLETILKISPTPHFRAFGASALEISWIAAGRLDVYLHSQFGGPWDFAAAYLIVLEAGGYAAQFDGTAANYLSEGAIIGHESYVKDIISQITL